MCYSTNNTVNPETEVTYDEKLPYGTNGYRTNCNHIQVRTASVESNPGLDWFCFITLCDWCRKLAPPTQQIICKSRLGLSRFPALGGVYMSVFTFPCSDWPLSFLSFWFYDTQSKSALKHIFVSCFVNHDPYQRVVRLRTQQR